MSVLLMDDIQDHWLLCVWQVLERVQTHSSMCSNTCLLCMHYPAGDIQSLFLSVLLLKLVMFYCQTIQLLSSTLLKVVNILTIDPNVCLLCAPTLPPLHSLLHAPDSTYCTNYFHYFIVSVNILSILAVER